MRAASEKQRTAGRNGMSREHGFVGVAFLTFGVIASPGVVWHHATMHRELSPAGLAPPAANYAHAILSTDVKRMVHTSGVVPTQPDGSVPVDVGEQAVVVWQTISTLLEAAEMTPANIVSVTTYVVADHMDQLGKVMAARDAALGAHKAASTLVTVPALAQDAWKMEIAVVATA